MTDVGVGATAIRSCSSSARRSASAARHQIVRKAVAVLHQQQQQRLQHELHRVEVHHLRVAGQPQEVVMGGRLLLGSEHRRDDGGRLLGVARVALTASLPPAWRSRACASHSDTAGR